MQNLTLQRRAVSHNKRILFEMARSDRHKGFPLFENIGVPADERQKFLYTNPPNPLAPVIFARASVLAASTDADKTVVTRMLCGNYIETKWDK